MMNKFITIFVCLFFVVNAADAQKRANVEGLGISVEAAGAIIPPVAVPTMAATPAAGVNVIYPLSAIPTAAANTAALLPSVPQTGDTYKIYNSGSNAVRIKAGGSATINGSAAGAYIPLAVKQKAECIAVSSTDYACSLQTVPTPAGP